MIAAKYLTALPDYWSKFSRWGNRFFATVPEQRVNTFLNHAYVLLITMGVSGLIAHEVILEIGVGQGWLLRDEMRAVDAHALPAFVGIIVTAAVALCAKNGKGWFSVSNTATLLAAMVFCAYLGILHARETGLHFMLINFFLFPLVLWQIQQIWLNLFLLAVNATLFFAVIWHQKSHPPLIRLPVDYEFFISLLVGFFLVVAFLFIVYYLTQGIHQSDAKYKREREARERLLKKVIPELQRSERRYAYLFEDAADIVFLLNERFEFKMVNRAVNKILRHSPESLMGKNFLTLSASDNRDDLDFSLMSENLASVLRNKEAVSFRASLRANFSAEPLDVQLSLTYCEVEGRKEIFGKASPLTLEKLDAAITYQRARYLLDNSFNGAEALSRQLCGLLQGRMEPAELGSIRVALREMLINAIEHGNLEVTFEEKTQTQADGTYFEFLRARQCREEFQHRRVVVEFLLREDIVAFKICDRGKGFDHRARLKEDGSAANELYLGHGRGIAMTRAIFDRTEYLGAGNQVIMVKHLIPKAAAGKARAWPIPSANGL